MIQENCSSTPETVGSVVEITEAYSGHSLLEVLA